MQDREGHGRPLHRGGYSHWRTDDGGGGGAPFGPFVEPSAGAAPPAPHAGFAAEEPRGCPQADREEQQAEETFKEPLSETNQLTTMALALDEVKEFILSLRSAGIKDETVAHLAQVSEARDRVRALALKAHLIALLNLMAQPGSVVERAGGLTEQEDDVVMKAWAALK